jgi:glutaredoxin
LLREKHECDVYGADWCPLTKRAIDWLKQEKIAFRYVDVDDHPEAAEWVREQNGGKEKKPVTVQVPA